MLTIVVILLCITLMILLFFLYRKNKSSPRNYRIDSQHKNQLSKSEIIRLKDIKKTDLLERLIESLPEKYTKVKALSAGGMGFIASAINTENNRKVTIKTILPYLQKDKKVIKLFFDECNTIKKMNHPNIVRMFEVCEKEDLYYYVMEYLNGNDLAYLIKQDADIPLSEVIKIGTQVSRALAHLHDNRIVHRDIKPSNIFITKTNLVKIIDFGLVKIITGGLDSVKGTTRIGTAHFSSPEQIQGGKISSKSDIYSFGICLFMMLSKRMPFKIDSLAARMFDKPIDVRKFRPETPNHLAAIIERCLDVDPKHRFSGGKIWEELRKIKV